MIIFGLLLFPIGKLAVSAVVPDHPDTVDDFVVLGSIGGAG
jgi:hypothetical protein